MTMHVHTPRLKNYAGRRFGKLTAIERAEFSGPSHWVFRCDCGATETRYLFGLDRTSACRACSKVRLAEHAENLRGRKLPRKRPHCAKCDRSLPPNIGLFNRKGRHVCMNCGATHRRCIECRKIKPLSKFRELSGPALRSSVQCTQCEAEAQRAKPPRKKRLCKSCGGLPHRVAGEVCKRCGLEFREFKDFRTINDFGGSRYSPGMWIDG